MEASESGQQGGRLLHIDSGGSYAEPFGAIGGGSVSRRPVLAQSLLMTP
jgi:20S proteasome alpha/beta subunit